MYKSYVFIMLLVVVVVVSAATGRASECVGKTHYDSQCDWLLLIQQSMPALKLLNVGAWTMSLGREFHRKRSFEKKF